MECVKLKRSELLALSDLYREYYGTRFEFNGVEYVINIRNKTAETKPRLYCVAIKNPKNNSGLFKISGERKFKVSLNGVKAIIYYDDKDQIVVTQKGANNRYEIDNVL